MTSTLVYLVRHAETDWNVLKKLQGQTNEQNLTLLGLKQAECLKKFFEENPVDLIFSSPMKRAMDSVKIVFPGKRVFTDHRLIERGFGEFEGKTWQEIEAIRPGLHALYKDTRTLPEVKGAETIEELQNRSVEALQDIIKIGEGKKIAVIVHGATIKTILLKILNKPFTFYKEIPQKNGCINLLEFSSKNFSSGKILIQGDLSHLQILSEKDFDLKR